MKRTLSRTGASVRTALHRSVTRLRTPATWPWRAIGVGAAATAALTVAVVAHDYSHRQRLANEQRVFNEGSPLQSLEASLRTGDVLVFSRAPVGLESGTSSSWHPARVATVTLQKMAGKAQHDHVALVIVRNDYPYILERDWTGTISLRPFDARLLHSSAHEIMLRRLEAPEPTEADLERMEAWVARLIGEKDSGMAAAGDAVVAGASTAVAPAASGREGGQTQTDGRSSPAGAPRLSPWSMLRHLMWVTLFPSSGSTAPSHSTPLVTLGQLCELALEAQQLAVRIHGLQARANEVSAAAQAVASQAKGGAGPKIQTSSSTLQRLRVRQREVLNRIAQLNKSLSSEPAAEVATVASSLPTVDPTDPDADLHVICDFPSAALVARGLQQLGVLPDARTMGQHAIELNLDPTTTTMTAQAATGSVDASSTPATMVRVPAERVPHITAYAPRHFLSNSHVPLLHMASLQQQQSHSRSSTPAVNGADVSSTTASADAPAGSLAEVSFHREMFLKMPHKALPYTLQEY